MFDFFGSKLEVGAVVAVTPKHYRGLALGVVTGFTPQKVRVEYENNQGHTIKFLTPPDTLVRKLW